MPQLTVEISQQQHDALQALAVAEEVPLSEIVLRALDSYITTWRLSVERENLEGVLETHSHLLSPEEVMDLDI
jgi:hypothetical protein